MNLAQSFGARNWNIRHGAEVAPRNDLGELVDMAAVQIASVTRLEAGRQIFLRPPPRLFAKM
jgi:hypothetical protein